MAKLSVINRNKKRIVIHKLFFAKRTALKKKIYDKSIDIQERFQLVIELSKLPRNASKTRIRNRCFLTGRPRGVIRKFGLARGAIRELASRGQIPGLTKASW